MPAEARSAAAVELPAAALWLERAYDDSPPAAVPLRPADLPAYRIEQQIDDEAGRFTGRVEIAYPNRTGKPLRELPLLLHPNASRELGVAPDRSGSLTITAVTGLDRGGAAPTGQLSFEQQRPTLVVVELEPPVAPDAPVRLGVAYRGTLRRLGPDANDLFAQALGSMGTITAGAGASDYGLLAVGDGILTAASAYPMVAPYRDGAFDTGAPLRFGDLAYNEPARFAVRTTTGPGRQVVTNLVDSPPVPLADGSLVVASQGSFVRDFVLIAGRDLETSSEQLGPTRIRSVYRRRDARGGQRALRVAVASLETFRREFGPYPYAELDVVEASLVGGAGGVEFSTMVLIAGMLYRRPEESTHPLALLLELTGRGGGRSQGSLWDRWGFGTGAAAPSATAAPPLSPSADPGRPAPPDPNRLMSDLLAQALDFTVAHEVAHQYFAGVIGNDSHRFPSLDEPIAQYAAGLVVEQLRGRTAAEAAMNANVRLNYAVYRALGGPDRPVLRPVDRFDTAAEYAGLVYGKAPYLYVELRRALGAERLHRAIRRAVARHRFRLLTTEAWIDALTAELADSAPLVRRTFDRYLRQTHGDADLQVDGSGDAVFDIMYGPALAAEMRRSFAALGMNPNALLRLSMGQLSGDAPAAPSTGAATPRAAPPARSDSSL